MAYLRAVLYLSICLCGIFYTSCQLQEEVPTSDASVRLSFSEDTIFFDTVFTSVGNITKRLKVFNPSPNAVEISQIGLNQPADSPFRLIVNGQPGNTAQNIRLLGRDSLLILVTVNIDPQDEDLPFIVEEQINFLTNGNQQAIPLVAWGQDAVFLRNQVIACNTTWSADRPYVIYDSILVAEGCQLTVAPGARIHLAPGAFFFVGGSLQMTGSAKLPIRIEGTRRDEPFRKVPGQWVGIFFLPESQNNHIAWTQIRNGTVGLYVGIPDLDTIPDLTITHTIIENMAISGIQAFSSDLVLANSLVNNCVVDNLLFLGGGNYTLIHNTIDADNGFFREGPAVIFSNYIDTQNGRIQEALSVEMTNNIIWGSQREELGYLEDGSTTAASFRVLAHHNLLRSEISSLAGNGNIIGANPNYKAGRNQDFRLDSLSPAINTALRLPEFQQEDLAGSSRDSLPDIGAFEFFQEE